jgi:hypothetical protein
LTSFTANKNLQHPYTGNKQQVEEEENDPGLFVCLFRLFVFFPFSTKKRQTLRSLPIPPDDVPTTNPPSRTPTLPASSPRRRRRLVDDLV